MIDFQSLNRNLNAWSLMLHNNVFSAPVAVQILKYFFFRLAACYLKLKLRQGIGLLNPDPDISNTSSDCYDG